jgi:hypothetical protein
MWPFVSCFSPDAYRGALTRIKSRPRNFSGFQILAHFAEPTGTGPPPAFRRRDTKRAPECVAEMTVTGETQVEGERGEIGFLLDQPFHCRAQTQAMRPTAIAWFCASALVMSHFLKSGPVKNLGSRLCRQSNRRTPSPPSAQHENWCA